MTARDNSGRDTEHEGVARGDAEHDGLAQSGAERGSAEHGSAEHGSAEHGSAEHGSAEHGSAEHGSAERGGRASGGAEPGDLASEDSEGDGLPRDGLPRDPREGRRRGGAAFDGGERGDPALGGAVGRAGLAGDGGRYVGRAGLNGHGGRYDDRAGVGDDGGLYDGPVYGGMDALTAALLDDPLPEEALEDAEFMASRDAAAADVALLREQLGLIGDALAATGEDAVAGVPPGRLVAARTGDAAGAETDPGRLSGPAQAPVAPVRPLPTRSARRRRALNVALGTLAAAVAAAAVFGVGRAVVQAGGVTNMTSSDARDGAKSDESQGDVDPQQENGGASLSREGYVACARLIVEGTVTAVEPVPSTGQDRITVAVGRWLKPDKGADQIVFPMEQDVDPRLRKGDHVFVSIPKESAQPDIWSTDEADIARDRAWIEGALPGARSLSCE
ncbi:hypothetical protein [Streptomyces sp. NPDC012510]|uniref:hypothetical protein n=1 Tax=Streptomyces sp. NPDC012510 TaxID=3364838 RepID=UPI0036E3B77D